MNIISCSIWLAGLLLLPVCYTTTTTTTVSSKITLHNHCLSTVWPRIVGQKINDSYELAIGQKIDLTIPMGWSGQIWARTGCLDKTGSKCLTGTPDTRSATQAVFNFSGSRGQLDKYSVSIVDGYNLPISINAIANTWMTVNGSRCSWNGCTTDLNTYCPQELALLSGTDIIGCQSPCRKFNTDDYCCRPPFVQKGICDASKFKKNYPALFHGHCPNMYTLDPIYEGTGSLYSCGGNPQTSFDLFFCPGPY
ncbi:uncharacterized protein LOC128956779 [Oppia nitens]|uniref:uncharacterized protein LOC128956779 n=1 Tax=Oppia nitens TaxID=1686743 RepID=UPI0023DAFA0B|nr:uncharacterized protein LOC128956779 [Oppia nitens]